MPTVGVVALVNFTSMVVYMIPSPQRRIWGTVDRRYQLYPVFGTFVAGFLWSLVLWGLEAPSRSGPLVASTAAASEAELQRTRVRDSAHLPATSIDGRADRQNDAASVEPGASSTHTTATRSDWGHEGSTTEQETGAVGFNQDDCNWFQRLIGYALVIEYGPTDDYGQIRRVRYQPIRNVLGK